MGFILDRLIKIVVAMAKVWNSSNYLIWKHDTNTRE